jgi:predicted dinucleotide-binding enzyme
MIVTIVGAGRLAAGIAVRVLAGGHELRLADSDRGKAESLAASLPVRVGAGASSARGAAVAAGTAEAIAGADVVVLALPYPEGRRTARDAGAALAGVIVVDTCNPVDFSTFDSLLTSPGMSAAEEIASVNPAARVVKAFNTTFAATLVPAGCRSTCSWRATTLLPRPRWPRWCVTAGCGRWIPGRCAARGNSRRSSCCT